MSLVNEWQIAQTWGGCTAVLKGIMGGIQPQRIVECGCGVYSTPILRNPSGHLLSIEHDQHWIKKIQKRFPPDTFHEYSVFPLSGINNGKDPKTIEPKILQSLRDFYNQLAENWKPFDFLMVDTYRCARVPAALALASKAKYVMLHDTRPYSRDYYEYHKLNNMFKDWFRYEHRPEGKINKIHLIPWTTLYSREPLELKNLQPFVIEESLRLWNMETPLELMHGS